MADDDAWEGRYDTEELSADKVGMEDGEEETESKVAQMADSWYESISREEVRRKMIVNYIYGVTDRNVSRQDAREIALRAGVIDGE